MADNMRLDKFLAEMGIGTRSQVKELAKKGRVTVNGSVEKKTDLKINPVEDCIAVDGNPVQYAAMEYYMLNKPQGVVSATEDKLHRTVIDLIRDRKRNDLFPVGRLDIDTEGLLLITNDGDLAHGLLAPRHHVDKVYFANVEGQLPDDAAEQFEQGIILTDGTETMPAKLEILKEEKRSVEDQKTACGIDAVQKTQVLLTIHEGKFHQVKRMFEALGCRVVYLKRVSMGSLQLDCKLAPGEYRALTKAELLALKQLTNEIS